MAPNNGSGAIYHDHSNTLVGVRHARITEQRWWAAAHAGIWLACSDARRTPSRWRGPSCPRGAAQAAAQWPLAAARRSPRATPVPRYTHQSTRITKPSSALFRNDRERQNRILRKLGTPDRRRGLEAGLCDVTRDPTARCKCTRSTRVMRFPSRNGVGYPARYSKLQTEHKLTNR